MTRNTSFFNQYLREFKGLGIVWEHRYETHSLCDKNRHAVC